MWCIPLIILFPSFMTATALQTMLGTTNRRISCPFCTFQSRISWRAHVTAISEHPLERETNIKACFSTGISFIHSICNIISTFYFHTISTFYFNIIYKFHFTLLNTVHMYGRQSTIWQDVLWVFLWDTKSQHATVINIQVPIHITNFTTTIFLPLHVFPFLNLHISAYKHVTQHAMTFPIQKVLDVKVH